MEKEYTIKDLQATGNHIFVIRDNPETQSASGVYYPDQALQRPNTGLILSVGGLVKDRSIRVGKKAVFIKSIGNDIKLFGETITILLEDQNLGVF